MSNRRARKELAEAKRRRAKVEARSSGGELQGPGWGPAAVPTFDSVRYWLDFMAREPWPYRVESQAAYGVTVAGHAAAMTMQAMRRGDDASAASGLAALEALVSQATEGSRRPSTQGRELDLLANTIQIVLMAYARGVLDLRDALAFVRATALLVPGPDGRLTLPGARTRVALGVTAHLALQITPEVAGEWKGRMPTEIRMLIGARVHGAKMHGQKMEDLARHLQDFGFLRQQVTPKTLDNYEREFLKGSGRKRPPGRPRKETSAKG